MKYAVVTSGGKQYKVSEGDTITVDRLPFEVEATYTFPEVLLFVGDAVKIGSPFLSDVSVAGKIIEHTKGEKIRISKFKAKAKYRRTTGFRSSLTKVQINNIDITGSKKEETKKLSAQKKHQKNNDISKNT